MKKLLLRRLFTNDRYMNFTKTQEKHTVGFHLARLGGKNKKWVTGYGNMHAEISTEVTWVVLTLQCLNSLACETWKS